jgi:hypothetical protein
MNDRSIVGTGEALVASAAVGKRNANLFWASCRAGKSVRDGKAAAGSLIAPACRSARQSIQFKSGVKQP